MHGWVAQEGAWSCCKGLYCILLRRLRESYGISGAALTWINSYLTDRQHSAVCLSCRNAVSAGVHQVWGAAGLRRRAPAFRVLLLIYDAVHNAMTSQPRNTNPYCMVVLHACIHARIVLSQPKPKIVCSATGSTKATVNKTQ